MSYLDRVAACHRWDPEAYRPLVLGATRFGRVPHDLARRLADFPDVFTVGARAVSLNPALADFESRTAAVQAVAVRLNEAGEIPRLRGEDYPVVRRWGEAPLFRIDRGAAPTFGVRGFGVHVNGYVGDPEGGPGGDLEGLRLWVGKRAMDKATAPGKLDHIIAGGQPYGLGILENLIKEAGEEAGLAPELARRAVPAGAVSYVCARDEGLRDDVLFCFDLQVPDDVVPVNTDGEVEYFELWPMARVLETIRDTEAFKFNVSLVTLDFAIRRGLITPDDPDYQAIWEGLRPPAPD